MCLRDRLTQPWAIQYGDLSFDLIVLHLTSGGEAPHTGPDDSEQRCVGGSNVASVSFYRDKNGNGTLEVDTDTLLGTDTDGSDGWSLATTAASKNSITSYFAQAKDSSNVTGNVVSARNRVGPGGPVAAIVASRDRYVGIDQIIASRYSDDDQHTHATDSDWLREISASQLPQSIARTSNQGFAPLANDSRRSAASGTSLAPGERDESNPNVRAVAQRRRQARSTSFGLLRTASSLRPPRPCLGCRSFLAMA